MTTIPGLDHLITEDTVWNNDVYLLAWPVTVFPGIKLTIRGLQDPVTVEFTGNGAINVQSGATVILDQVVFQSPMLSSAPTTAAPTGTPGSPTEAPTTAPPSTLTPTGGPPTGVVFLNPDTAYLNATGWTCQRMISCVQANSGNRVYVEDSIFQDNGIAINGQGDLTVRDSLFLRNGLAIGYS